MLAKQKQKQNQLNFNYTLDGNECIDSTMTNCNVCFGALALALVLALVLLLSVCGCELKGKVLRVCQFAFIAPERGCEGVEN